MLDSSPPVPEFTSADELTPLVNFARDLGGLFGKELPITADELHSYAPSDRIAYLLGQARQHGVVPPDIDSEQMQRLADVYQANRHAAQRYRPEPLRQSLILFQASELPAAQQPYQLADCWRALATSIEAHHVPGNHYTMLQAPQVQALAARLESCLQQTTHD